LLAHAQRESAVFFPTDKDFSHTVLLAFARHHGEIVVVLRRPNRDKLLRRLADALAALGERNLDDSVWLVTDTRICSRQKP
jgi:hypothetical protein